MAAVSSSLGIKSPEEKTCGICKDLFPSLKMLPCQHTFCQDCLQDLATWGEAFQCPNCRQQVSLTPRVVEDLPNMHYMCNMCEMFEKLTLQQRRERREQPGPQSGNRCRFHPTEKVKLYCKQCNVPICIECCEEGHDGHPTTGLKKAAQERRCTVQALINAEPIAIPAAFAFGGRGSGTGRIKSPFGVTVSEQAEIFVADRGNQRIQVFTLQGTFVRQFPTVVSDEQKIDPDDVAMDRVGNLWVVGGTDCADFAVQYNKQGRVLRKFHLHWKQETWQNRGVAVDTRSNHILITQTTGVGDNRRGVVLDFQPDGTFVRTVGRQKGMKHPWYITVDMEGNILVSDFENHCVYVYNKDRKFLFQFGGLGRDEGQLYQPRGICTDRVGNIIVADSGNWRVEKFDKKGRFLSHSALDMAVPCAVAVATQGQLVVTDDGNNRVSILSN